MPPTPQQQQVFAPLDVLRIGHPGRWRPTRQTYEPSIIRQTAKAQLPTTQSRNQCDAVLARRSPNRLPRGSSPNSAGTDIEPFVTKCKGPAITSTSSDTSGIGERNPEGEVTVRHHVERAVRLCHCGSSRSARSVVHPRRARGGSEHATGRRRRAHDQLRRAGGGRAAPADPLHVCRPRLLGVPAAGLHRALQLHRHRPSRLGRERQAARAVLDRGLCRPGRRLPRRHRDRAGPRRGHVVRRRRGHPPGRPPSRPRALALVAQRLARQRRLSEDRRRAVAHARVVRCRPSRTS